MEPSEKEERCRRHMAEGARKQLAKGTWPQVMAVFGYRNPEAPRTSENELDRLKTLYEQGACPNIVQFIELLRFAEKEHRVTMSFNFSMRHRLVPGETPELTEENAILLLSCPDILVGTRRGVEGAAVWLKTFSEAVRDLPPESVRVIDKIFGEAIEFLRGPSRTTTVREVFESAVLGEGEVGEPLKVSEH